MKDFVIAVFYVACLTSCSGLNSGSNATSPPGENAAAGEPPDAPGGVPVLDKTYFYLRPQLIEPRQILNRNNSANLCQQGYNDLKKLSSTVAECNQFLAVMIYPNEIEFLQVAEARGFNLDKPVSLLDNSVEIASSLSTFMSNRPAVNSSQFGIIAGNLLTGFSGISSATYVSGLSSTCGNWDTHNLGVTALTMGVIYYGNNYTTNPHQWGYVGTNTCNQHTGRVACICSK